MISKQTVLKALSRFLFNTDKRYGTKKEVSKKYERPSTGIPESDLSEEVQDKLNFWETEYFDQTSTYEEVLDAYQAGVVCYMQCQITLSGEVHSLILPLISHDIAINTFLFGGSIGVSTTADEVPLLITYELESGVRPAGPVVTQLPEKSDVTALQQAFEGLPIDKGAGVNSIIQKVADGGVYVNTVSSDNSAALGKRNTVSAQTSFAFGHNNNVSDAYSAAIGRNNVVTKQASVAIGRDIKVTNDYEVSIGRYNISVPGARFTIGIGSDSNNKQNAFLIDDTGKVYVPNIGSYAGTESDAASLTNKDLATAVNKKYEKPANGIPASDIEAGVIPAAQVNSDWNASSGVAEILNKPTIPTVPTNVSAFTNDAGYLTSHQDISGKADKVTGATNGNFAGLDTNGNLIDSGKKASDFQETLSSGTNIKTINGSSILGSGNLNIVSSSNVAIVEYGIATFSDISSAINDGKTVLCHYTGSIGNNRYLVDSGSVGVVPDVNLFIPIAGIHIGPGTNPSSCVFITTIGVYNNMADQELISIKLILDAGYDMPGTWNVEITNFITLPS